MNFSNTKSIQLLVKSAVAFTIHSQSQTNTYGHFY